MYSVERDASLAASEPASLVRRERVPLDRSADCSGLRLTGDIVAAVAAPEAVEVEAPSLRLSGDADGAPPLPGKALRGAATTLRPPGASLRSRVGTGSTPRDCFRRRSAEVAGDVAAARVDKRLEGVLVLPDPPPLPPPLLLPMLPPPPPPDPAPAAALAPTVPRALPLIMPSPTPPPAEVEALPLLERRKEPAVAVARSSDTWCVGVWAAARRLLVERLRGIVVMVRRRLWPRPSPGVPVAPRAAAWCEERLWVARAAVALVMVPPPPSKVPVLLLPRT